MVPGRLSLLNFIAEMFLNLNVNLSNEAVAIRNTWLVSGQDR